MRGFGWQSACIAFTAFVALHVGVARGDTIQVTYTTTGSFAVGSSGGSLSAGKLIKTGSSGSIAELSFAGTAQSYTVDFDQLLIDAVLGEFTAKLTGTANVNFTGALFTLTLQQTLPTPGGTASTTTSSITGTIKGGTVLDFGGSFIQFPNPAQGGEPTIQYFPKNITLSTGNNSTSTYAFKGDIDAIPVPTSPPPVPVSLPMSAAAGLTLIVSLGLARFARPRMA
jgi:hypothetical protein